VAAMSRPLRGVLAAVAPPHRGQRGAAARPRAAVPARSPRRTGYAVCSAANHDNNRHRR